MPNAFDSPRRKIQWAQHHLIKVKRIISHFHRQKNLYELFSEPDPNIPQRQIHKMRFAKQPPWFLDDTVSDVVSNLRAALDHAVYAVSTAAGNRSKGVRKATFPFAYTEDYFESSLRRNCKDVPPEIHPLIRGYKPYKGGENTLWALNAVRGTNEHALVVPAASVIYAGPSNFSSVGGFVSMPYAWTWDRTKNEMELFTIGPGAKLQCDLKFACAVEFGEIEAVAGQAVIPTLDLFAEMVATIVNEIEAETRRLGFNADL
ncbi:MAG: hypothetical protein ABSG11_21435 [Candidatus Korobacteraceae bacterium]